MPIETFSLKYDDLNVNRDSLLQAMGYAPGSSSPVTEIVDEAVRTGAALFDIRGGYNIFDSVQLDRSHFSILVDGAALTIHKIVFGQVRQSTRVAVFACTAGAEITTRSKSLMKNGDLLGGYVYDLFGSIVVEDAMDLIQGRLQNEMKRLGLAITNRFSPGYCGWDVAEQQRLFKLLPDRFCGIQLTASSLMLPAKSVSGIIGIGESVKYHPYTCNLCDMKNCLYRNLKRKMPDPSLAN
jgi:drug/metabolite transporter superfamily protein YnfA